MILNPQQVPILLGAAETLSGRSMNRLRRKLGKKGSDADQLELVAMMAALSVCDAEPEEEESGPQPRASADFRCTLRSGRRFLLECLHVGGDLSMGDSLRPPLHVGFLARVEEELDRAGVQNGKRVALGFRNTTRNPIRVPPRSTWAEMFAGAGFQSFVAQLRSRGDGKAIWHVQDHAFLLKADGFDRYERLSELPPDFREHPVYKGLKRKMGQVSEFAEPDAPTVLLLAVTNAVPLVHRVAMGSNWSSGRVCQAAFGVPGVGDLVGRTDGWRTLGRIQGIERVAAAMILELSPPNYWPVRTSSSVVLNPNTEHPLPREAVAALLSMVLVTYRSPPLDSATLCREYVLRREALAWNAKSEEERQGEVEASIAAAKAGVESTGSLAALLKQGLSVRVPKAVLTVWPAR
jgi:hypothetical protein